MEESSEVSEELESPYYFITITWRQGDGAILVDARGLSLLETTAILEAAHEKAKEESSGIVELLVDDDDASDSEWNQGESGPDL